MSAFDIAVAGIHASAGGGLLPTVFASPFAGAQHNAAPHSPPNMTQLTASSYNDHQNTQLAALIAAATSIGQSAPQQASSSAPSINGYNTNALAPMINGSAGSQNSPLALTTPNGTIYFSNIQQLTPVIMNAAQTPNNNNGGAVVYIPNIQQLTQPQQQAQSQPSPPQPQLMSNGSLQSLNAQNALQLLQANLLSAAAQSQPQPAAAAAAVSSLTAHSNQLQQQSL